VLIVKLDPSEAAKQFTERKRELHSLISNATQNWLLREQAVHLRVYSVIGRYGGEREAIPRPTHKDRNASDDKDLEEETSISDPSN
jgi:DNA-binding FadR family transcriptional regulator